jgi:hypothetical protein
VGARSEINPSRFKSDQSDAGIERRKFSTFCRPWSDPHPIAKGNSDAQLDAATSAFGI